MTYTKKEFGLGLKAQLLQRNDYSKISKWAFKIYIDEGLRFEDDLDYIVLKLIAMEEGPEFIFSKEDLLILANKLINE
jgi:hypothetical protein